MFRLLIIMMTLLFPISLFPTSLQAAQCGNGIKEGAEECDRGANNSDSKPNGCRTDCRLFHCGDGIVDNNEECDDGDWGNHNKIPGACRSNCKEATCGDGIIDYMLGEECDDSRPECTDCRKCLKPRDELMVNQGYDGHFVKICPGAYTIDDKANNGTILVTGSNLIVDCTDMVLQSAGFTRLTPKPKQEFKKPLKKPIFKPMSFNFINEAHAAPISAPTTKRGVGIVVTGSNNTLINCNVKGFRIGVHLKGKNNTLVNNTVCGNNIDIKNQGSNNQGHRNQCRTQQQWKDAGSNAGCNKSC